MLKSIILIESIFALLKLQKIMINRHKNSNTKSTPYNFLRIFHFFSFSLSLPLPSVATHGLSPLHPLSFLLHNSISPISLSPTTIHRTTTARS